MRMRLCGQVEHGVAARQIVEFVLCLLSTSTANSPQHIYNQLVAQLC